MKQELKNRLNNLRLTETAPHGDLKDRQLDDFFIWISGLSIDDVGEIDDQISGDIRYREVVYNSQSEDFLICVTVIQSAISDMIIIDADFGEEEG